jgi:hypothetical protein
MRPALTQVACPAGRPRLDSHLSPKAFHFCRHSLLHGCGRSRCRRSGFLLCRELVIANPMSGLRWQVVLVVTTGQYALSRFKGGVAMSNFIQCNTETGEVIYVNLDLVLKVRVLKSKGTTNYVCQRR